MLTKRFHELDKEKKVCLTSLTPQRDVVVVVEQRTCPHCEAVPSYLTGRESLVFCRAVDPRGVVVFSPLFLWSQGTLSVVVFSLLVQGTLSLKDFCEVLEIPATHPQARPPALC